MDKEYKMSQARKDELEQELNYLKTTRSDEVAEQIKIARGFGDLSENSEYDDAISASFIRSLWRRIRYLITRNTMISGAKTNSRPKMIQKKIGRAHV